jgi:cell division protein FtsB
LKEEVKGYQRQQIDFQRQVERIKESEVRLGFHAALFRLTGNSQDALQTQLAESSARGAALEAQIQELKSRETQLRSSNKVRLEPVSRR